ncbi:MAG TPA: efflux RND transporter permease subunit, partial [Nannocystis exedens]|nr:efflux RND transporter permease subunit [Nannocystis exedens]
MEVNRALAEAANLNIFQIAQTLSQASFNLASGEIRESSGRYVIRSLATYQTIDELRQTVVGANDLRLQDIAEIVYEHPESERIDRFNGRSSMVMFVLKESQANTVEVCDRIKAAVEEASRAPVLNGFDLDPIFLQGDAIRFSLTQVVTSGAQGGGLALIVLLFFLRRLRLTLIIAGSIPLSIFLALPVMYFAGQSVNLVSLLGLMICIGLVVDNSVVVAENIERYRTRGVGRYAAALHGAGEVALPITLATLTTMVVFAPAALLTSGPTQFFMIRMVTPVCVSLMASLFVALVLVPITSAIAFGEVRAGPKSRLLRRLLIADAAWKKIVGRFYEATLGRLNRFYSRFLRIALRRRFDVAFIALLALALTAAVPMQRVPFSKGENMGSRNFWTYYSMPGDTSIEEAEAFFSEVERVIREHKEEFNISGQYIGADSTFGQVQIFFDKQKDDEPPFSETRQKVYDLLPNRPGWRKSARFASSDGAKESSFIVKLYGDDHASVQAAKEDLERALVGQKGVIGPSSRGNDDVRRDELALAIDRTMSERFGISAGLVANTIAYAIRGQLLPRYRSDDEDREINVRIRYRKADREQLSQLREFKVPTREGASVPIRVLTEAVIQ